MILLWLACEPPFEAIDLQPYENPFGPGDPGWAPQPRRENPTEVLVSEGVAWVSLQGSPDEPGRNVARVDLASGAVDWIEVGSSPTGLALHPDGSHLAVFNRFSNYASVLDIERIGRGLGEGQSTFPAETDRVPADFYAIEGVFSLDGSTLWVTNRWHDAVEAWGLDEDLNPTGEVERIPVGHNPRDIALSADGQTIAAAALTGLTVSLIDTEDREERKRIDVGAPVNGLAFAGEFLVVATLSRATHHLPLAGPDTDGDGLPGDGTPNVNFQDLNNELAVYRVQDGEEVWRYTSDTICCKDYRDVFPEDVALAGDLLPPEDTWIVGGALPEQLAVDGETLVVTYSGSNEWQRFAIDLTTGSLTAGPVTPTGHNPHGIAVSGDRVYVANRLGETLGIYDLDGTLLDEIVVGDLSGGDFPATDAEIGEVINFETAPLSVDGDQVCTQCHREGGNMDKSVSMPLTIYRGLGSRMTMAYRGLADTRPWFFESGMDETNFKPVLNEFARIENFCCSDYTLFPDGFPADCEANPPPECTTEGNPGTLDVFEATRDAPFHPDRPTPWVTRDQFALAAMEQLTGRRESFGDGLYLEDPVTGAQSPMPLDFDGTTRELGLFLLQEPRLFPNPNLPTAASARGEALFNRMDVACMTCHPAPTFAVSTENNPFELSLRMGPVVTPNRDADGNNLDLFTDGFVQTFPLVEEDSCTDVCGDEDCAEDPAVCNDLRDVRFGVPTLRGVWDRAPSMLHDGRAQGLREVLCTPGHPALLPGETGFNERDGVPDTHGATSHLSKDEIADLIAFLVTL